MAYARAVNLTVAGAWFSRQFARWYLSICKFSVFGAAPLAIRPDHEVDRIAHVGHKDPVLLLAGFELILLGLLGFYFLAHG